MLACRVVARAALAKFTEELTSEGSASPRQPKSSADRDGAPVRHCEAAEPDAALAAQRSAMQDAGMPVSAVSDAVAVVQPDGGKAQEKVARTSPESSQVSFLTSSH